MKRIVVVGSQGSGKTHLSLALGRKLGLPVIHLDVLYWRPGWKPSDLEGFRARVAEAVAGEGWIVDGSYSGLAMDLTLARADQLIVIERPRWLTVWRVLWRSAFQRRGSRPDLPQGCPETFDWSVVKQSWGYNSDRRPRVEADVRKFGAHIPIARLHNDHEIANFIS